ncbi:MAG: methyltransferase [Crocinitomicaceae bacterium]|nr:methyltransferase [Crocinitomicaceae bacterium]|tara:strand:- start:4758 stop:5432 length:675 start_codon:yes stop_codon:yes gene_type:complete
MFRKAIRKSIKFVVDPWLRWSYNRYASKDLNIDFFGCKIVVQPRIFHPGLFFSTKTLIYFLKTIEVSGKTMLELGCGTGAISVWAAKMGAEMVASDINPKAIENTRINALNNGVSVKTVQSDLFTNLIPNEYQIVIINPPYYAKSAATIEEQAWYCGVEFEYFHKLFEQLTEKSVDTVVYMVLSEDCDLEKVYSIAKLYSLSMDIVYRRSTILEKNFIFRIATI